MGAFRDDRLLHLVLLPQPGPTARMRRDRGELFEAFVESLLVDSGQAGSSRTRLLRRVSKLGGEIDLVVDTSDSPYGGHRTLVECKAQQKPISVKQLNAFYGTLAAARTPGQPRLHGLFISLSPLNARAEERARAIAIIDTDFRWFAGLPALHQLPVEGLNERPATAAQDAHDPAVVVTAEGIFYAQRARDASGSYIERVELWARRGRVPTSVLALLRTAPYAGGVLVVDISEVVGPGGLTIPHQLPGNIQAKPLGRVGLVVEATASATRTNPLAVDGPPGVGKTTVAVAVARQLSRDFPGGEVYLDLRGTGDGAPVSTTDALTYCISSLPGAVPSAQSEADLAAHYRTLLAANRSIVVLDNAADEAQVAPLMPNSESHSLVIVVSRLPLRRLGLTRDAYVTVSPLDDEAAKALLELTAGTRFPATASLDQLLTFCGGSPFWLELLGWHLRAEGRTPQSVTSAWDALRDSGQDARALHLAMRALSPDGSLIFRAMCAIGIGEVPIWMMAAVQDKLALSGRAIRNVADTRLVTIAPAPAGYSRIRMHDIVLEFGRLIEQPLDDVREPTRAALAAHVAVLVSAQQRAEPFRFSYAGTIGFDTTHVEHALPAHGDAVLRVLEDERVTTGTVLRALLASHEFELHMIACSTLPFCLAMRGTWSSWIENARRAITHAQTTGNWRAEAHLRQVLNNLLRIAGDPGAGFGEARAAKELFEAHGDDVGAAYLSIDIAIERALAGEPRDGVALLEHAINTFISSGSPYWVAVARKELGALLADAGDEDRAIQELDAARASFESFGDERWLAYTDLNRGDAFRARAAREPRPDERARWLSRAQLAYDATRTWSKASDETRVYALATLGLAATEASRDNTPEAHRLLGAADLSFRGIADARSRSLAKVFRAHVYYTSGALAKAISEIDSALPELNQAGDPRRVAEAALIAGNAVRALDPGHPNPFQLMTVEDIASRVPTLTAEGIAGSELRREYAPRIPSWF